MGEKKAIETFIKYLNNHEVMKRAAKEVLRELASCVEEDDSEDLCNLLVCVIAPRCGFLPASADKDLAMLAAQLDASLVPVSIKGETNNPESPRDHGD